MKIVVTGGGGFIGSHVAERLLREGHDVRVLDNFSSGHRENLLGILDSLELVEGDVQSYERVHNAVRGREIVFHQAALPSVPRSVQDPLTTNASNITGTLNVLLAARDSGVRRVVFASSSSVYGANEELPKREDMRLLPISPYSVSKVASEGYCRSFSAVYGLETVALRYFNVFGPRQDPLSQYAAVIPNFIRACLDGRAPVVFGDGEQSRDFTYVENVVEANLLAMDARGVDGEAFNIACGEQTTVNQLLEHLQKLTSWDGQPRYEKPRAGDLRASLADVSRAERQLGYRPRVSLAEGLSRTLPYHQERVRPSAGAPAPR
jgi:UDP-glucose 4-epimerase